MPAVLRTNVDYIKSEFEKRVADEHYSIPTGAQLPTLNWSKSIRTAEGLP